MSMTREEVKYASKDYVNYLLDKQEYHNEKYTEYDIRQAFEMGAKWVEEHKNIQHDANEKPRTKEWLLVQFAEDDYDTIYLYIDIWCDLCKTFNVIQWAYISEMLPKGGEK